MCSSPLSTSWAGIGVSMQDKEAVITRTGRQKCPLVGICLPWSCDLGQVTSVLVLASLPPPLQWRAWKGSWRSSSQLWHSMILFRDVPNGHISGRTQGKMKTQRLLLKLFGVSRVILEHSTERSAPLSTKPRETGPADGRKWNTNHHEPKQKWI